MVEFRGIVWFSHGLFSTFRLCVFLFFVVVVVVVVVQNLLEDRIKHANSAVVMATAKVFLHFTRNSGKVHAQVYSHLKSTFVCACT